MLNAAAYLCSRVIFLHSAKIIILKVTKFVYRSVLVRIG